MHAMALRIGNDHGQWRLVLCALVGACGSTEVRTVAIERVVPVADPDCGAPVGGRTLLVRALGEFPPTEATATSRSIDDGGEFRIEGFPSDTRVLELQVIRGAAVQTIGRTREFDLETVADGAALRVFMAPPNGACQTGPPRVARHSVLATRAGAGVLVAGGVDADGAAAVEVEWYDPDNARFVALGDSLYGSPMHGLRGATMTTLADRVAVIGGAIAGYQTYDPATQSFSAPRLLTSPRAFHAAIALDESRVLVAGGCSLLTTAGVCEIGHELSTTSIIDVVTDTVEPGPALRQVRIGGHAYADQNGRIVLVGGVDIDGTAVMQAERLSMADNTSTLIADVHGVPAPLRGGGAVVAFSNAAVTSTGQAVVLAPSASRPTDVSDSVTARSGPTLTPLDDGAVLAFGGRGVGPGDEASLYVPQRTTFERLNIAASPNLSRYGHAAVRLDDGSVLIVGGRTDDEPALADAWIVRPELTGRFTSDASLAFGSPELARLAIPSDPAFVTEIEADPVAYAITSSEQTQKVPSQWAVVAGPEFAQPRISLSFRSISAGLAVLIGFVDVDNFLSLVVRAGQPAIASRVAQGNIADLDGCVGDMVSSDLYPDSTPITAMLTADSGLLTLSIAGTEVLRCAQEQPPTGAIGWGVVGEAGTATIELTSLSARR